MENIFIDAQVGELLHEEFVVPHKISIKELADAINVSVEKIQSIINNQQPITIDIDLRLCKFFGLSDGFFIRIQDHYNVVATKRLLQGELDKIKTLKNTSNQYNFS